LGNGLKLWIPVIAVAIFSISIISSVDAQGNYSIPAWVKGVAGFWAEDKITDQDFGEGLSFLIDQEIIKVPKILELENKIAQLEAEIAFLKNQDGGTQSPPAITVSTDRYSYKDGDTIRVSGKVSELLSGYAISLQVIAPDGNRVIVEQLDVSYYGNFSTELTAGGILWEDSGTYTIMVLYGTTARTAETSFYFSGSTVTGGTTPSIDVEGYNVGFQITGGSILSIASDVEFYSLIIEISTTSDGELTITLPRALLDSVLYNGNDDVFFVLVDSDEVFFYETRTSSDRTLTIAFPDGAEEIEIIGTFVVS